MATEWYYRSSTGRVEGPFSGARLRQIAQFGKINSETEIRRGADGRWLSANRVKGLLETDTPKTEPLSQAQDPVKADEEPELAQPSSPPTSAGREPLVTASAAPKLKKFGCGGCISLILFVMVTAVICSIISSYYGKITLDPKDFSEIGSLTYIGDDHAFTADGYYITNNSPYDLEDVEVLFTYSGRVYKNEFEFAARRIPGIHFKNATVVHSPRKWKSWQRGEKKDLSQCDLELDTSTNVFKDENPRYKRLYFRGRYWSIFAMDEDENAKITMYFTTPKYRFTIVKKYNDLNMK